jgi:hypothetical protein
MPLNLSDDELRIIQDCSRPLAPQDRAKFVEAVAGELEKYRELDPGLVSRVSRELQRQHFDPPSFRRRLRQVWALRGKGGLTAGACCETLEETSISENGANHAGRRLSRKHRMFAMGYWTAVQVQPRRDRLALHFLELFGFET